MRATTTSSARARRGNALILVAGILVLLVIVATAYVTRTQGARVTAAAMQRSAARDDGGRAIAEGLAQETADALFAWPIDASLPADRRFWSDPATRRIASSNAPRLSPRRNPVRYGVDHDPDGDGIPQFPYNASPFHTVPYTNLPDDVGLLGGGGFGGGDAPQWPRGPGSPDGLLGFASGNPIGNPGTNDTRWLRDVEPRRWDIDLDGLDDAFLIWGHLSYPPRANNGWRLVRDISDVTDANEDGIGGLLLDLSIPVEQWPLTVQPDIRNFQLPSGNVYTGDANLGYGFADTLSGGNGHSDFIDLWQNWMSLDRVNPQPQFGYSFAYRHPEWIPPNLYNLGDLDADGNRLEDGERPRDAFEGPSAAWPLGSPRWNVLRILDDADGDGYTDSFYFDVPPTAATAGRGVRQIVSVSFVDNGGLFNANGAGPFIPGHLAAFGEPTATMGETPADIAAAGQRLAWDGVFPPPASWNVGFFDAFDNWEGAFDYPQAFADTGWTYPLYNESGDDDDAPQIAWSANRWDDFLEAIGVSNHPRAGAYDALETARQRRRYWLNGASRPLGARDGLTPFGIADEIELRLHHGQNDPWILSRFERAVNIEQGTGSNRYAFLRSPRWFDESTEYRRRLRNTELLYDHRRKITLFSGSRNDLLPPWLRWRWQDNPATPPAARREQVPRGVDLEDRASPGALARFLDRSNRKLDLRERRPELLALKPGERALHERLPWTLMHALTDGLVSGPPHVTIGPGSSYLGAYDEATIDRVRRLAASYSANILERRDRDDAAPLVDDPGTTRFEVGAVPLPEWGKHAEDPTTRFLGMERQPFICEAFIAHVYSSANAVPDDTPPAYEDEGENVVTSDDRYTTIVVVQIANPFPKPPGHPLGTGIDLADYGLRVAGRLKRLRRPAGGGALAPLLPASEARPVTATFYAIADEFDGKSDFRTEWLDFLDLSPAELAPGSLVVDAEQLEGDRWPKFDRDHYDGYAGDHPIELVRFDDTLSPAAAVVVDRVNQVEGSDGGLRGLLEEMADESNRPPAAFDSMNVDDPVFAGIRIGDDDHWAQWIRVARAWGNDFDFDPLGWGTHGVQPHERAPRFVFSRQSAEQSDEVQKRRDRVAGGGGSNSTVAGSAYTFADDPDASGSPWFDREHASDAWRAVLPSQGTGVDYPRRKPTFFNVNPVYAASGEDLYPEFLDAAYGYGAYFYGRTPASGGGRFGVPDKGVYHFEASLQLLQKDGDYQRVGELLDTWLWCHELRFDEVSPGVYQYERTAKTFSEHMTEELDVPGEEIYVNRLRHGELIGQGAAADPLHRLHAVPDLPAGLRVLDAFVCDGPGAEFDLALGHVEEDFLFGNAAGFTGRATPGQINLNTATLEVLRALPQWYKVVHTDPVTRVPAGAFPPVALAEAVISYRERFANDHPAALPAIGFAGGPDYESRRFPDAVPGAAIRGDRGLATVGELRLLERAGRVPVASTIGTVDENAWRVDYLRDTVAATPGVAEGPFAPVTDGASLSTDVARNGFVDDLLGDGVAADAEEANLLLSGVTNLVTTRSDMFTVYFHVRSFRQNPNGTLPGGYTGPVWDATDPEFIEADARYVMLVDRSEVNTPTDRPKILFLEKLAD